MYEERYQSRHAFSRPIRDERDVIEKMLKCPGLWQQGVRVDPQRQSGADPPNGDWPPRLDFPASTRDSSPMVAPLTTLKPLFAATTRKAISHPLIFSEENLPKRKFRPMNSGNKEHDIAELWDRVPQEYREGAHGAQRYLLPLYRAKWIACFFRGSQKGVPPRVLNQHSVPERMPHIDTGPPDPEKQRRFKHILGFTYIIAGGVELRFERQGLKTARPGDLVIISRAQERVEVVRYLPGLREMAVHVDGLTGHMLWTEEIWDLPPGIIGIGKQSNLVKHIVELQRDIGNYGISSASLVRSFIAIIEEVANLTRTHSPEERFRSVACGELAARAGETGAVEEVAALLGLSVRHFRRRFEALMGQSPRDYLLEVRMAQANHLLTFCSVKETAARLGYDDPFGFSRQYKKMFGTSPSQARSGG